MFLFPGRSTGLTVELCNPSGPTKPKTIKNWKPVRRLSERALGFMILFFS